MSDSNGSSTQSITNTDVVVFRMSDGDLIVWNTTDDDCWIATRDAISLTDWQ